MKLKTLLIIFVFGLSLTSISHANDINLSWSMRTLQGQALTQTIKQSKFKKYLNGKIQKSVKTNENTRHKDRQNPSSELRTTQ